MRGVNEDGAHDRLTPYEYQVFTLEYLTALYQHLAYDSYLVIFTFPKIRRMVEQVIHHNFGQLEFFQEVIWHYEFGLYTRRRFVPSHDNILIYRFGKPPFNWEAVAIESQRLQAKDKRADIRGRTPGTVFNIPRVPGNSLTRRYVTGYRRSQQPEELVKRLILSLTNPNHIVIDPFTGTGTVPRVCRKFKRYCYAFDICEHYIDEARTRLNPPLKDVIR